MSGTELKTSHEAAEVSVGADGKRSYTAHWQAKMSSAADGPAAVLNYVESNNLYFGAPYSYNGDVDSTAFCNGIQPRRRAGSVEWWDVTVTYAPPAEEDNQDDDGNASDEPNDWRWQHTMGYSTWQEPVWAAWNITAFPHPDSRFDSTFMRGVSTYGAVVNSANVVLDPPLMRDLFDRVWQITTFSRTYDSAYADAYMGYINHTPIKYHTHLAKYYAIAAASFNQYAVKCTNASATYRILTRGTQRIPYWEWAWEFRFRRGGGWIEYVLDRGLSSLPEDGMPTGEYPYLEDDAITRGRAPVIPVTDEASRRIPELQLFDGAGKPMLPDDHNYEHGYYFGWQKDAIADFSYPTLPFKFFSLDT